MAAVIHRLWEGNDRSPLILPASVPLDDPVIVSQLTGYLPGGWETVIEKDVDGMDALPRKLDGEKPNLGRYSACRRVARTLFLGSAPILGAANRGEEDRRIKLGCVLPGEAPAVFGDALRHLAQAATYLYQDNARYWYLPPHVTHLAFIRWWKWKNDLRKAPRLDKIPYESPCTEAHGKAPLRTMVLQNFVQIRVSVYLARQQVKKLKESWRCCCDFRLSHNPNDPQMSGTIYSTTHLGENHSTFARYYT